MPRRKLARRFEPRYGVSEMMLETEAGYVAREMSDYLLLSINELKAKLAERQELARQSEVVLRNYVESLPEREAIAIQAMMVRDFYHIAELHLMYLRQAFPAPAAVPAKSVEAVALPFTEYLFGKPK
jgi:tetrahydromethanopterin S-methyltransferase subunit B